MSSMTPHLHALATHHAPSRPRPCCKKRLRMRRRSNKRRINDRPNERSERAGKRPSQRARSFCLLLPLHLVRKRSSPLLLLPISTHTSAGSGCGNGVDDDVRAYLCDMCAAATLMPRVRLRPFVRVSVSSSVAERQGHSRPLRPSVGSSARRRFWRGVATTDALPGNRVRRRLR